MISNYTDRLEPGARETHTTRCPFKPSSLLRINLLGGGLAARTPRRASLEFTAHTDFFRVACLLPGQRRAASSRGPGPLSRGKVGCCRELSYALVWRSIRSYHSEMSSVFALRSMRTQLRDCHLFCFALSHGAAQRRCTHLLFSRIEGRDEEISHLWAFVGIACIRLNRYP